MQTTVTNPDQVTYREVLAMFGWTDAQFSQARTHGFPASHSTRFSRSGHAMDSLFSRSRIADWQKDFLKLANQVARATTAPGEKAGEPDATV